MSFIVLMNRVSGWLGGMELEELLVSGLLVTGGKASGGGSDGLGIEAVGNGAGELMPAIWGGGCNGLGVDALKGLLK